VCRRQVKNKGYKSRLLSLFAPPYIFFVAMCIIDHVGLYPINEKIPWKVSDSRSPSQVDTYKYLLLTLGKKEGRDCFETFLQEMLKNILPTSAALKGNCMEKCNNFPSDYNDFIEKSLMTV
jgi:hypothetical protein